MKIPYFCQQEVVKSLEQHRDEAKWLRKSLEALGSVLDRQELEQERETLNDIIQRYQQLLPAVEISASRSSIVVRCHEYKEAVERQMQWLSEAEERVRDDVPLDGLESVRSLLNEQEACWGILKCC